MTIPVSELGSVHIIGIGGAGMSGIARILVERGVTVSGSDAKDSRRLAALQAIGVTTHVGHDAKYVEGVDTVIFSTAIPEKNPERQEAQNKSLRILNRAEALAAIMTGSRGVAVAGTHGKTTTTSMLTVALQHCGADPSFAIGSELNESGSNAHLGSGDVFVAEADESDGAFLFLPAVAGIVTNVEADHLNHWGTFEAVEQGFVDFVMGIAANDGFTVVCADDPGARRLAAAFAFASRLVILLGLIVTTRYVRSKATSKRCRRRRRIVQHFQFDAVESQIVAVAIFDGIEAHHLPVFVRRDRARVAQRAQVLPGVEAEAGRVA
jgi:UDP-N-acetylmuramate--alanine ligase